MSIKLHKIHKKPGLRRIVLSVLKRFNPGDICIRHHYTGQGLLLHSFKHKGYWFHGRRRERETMRMFAACLKHGYTAIEVGGHIGYVSLYLAQLVGPDGKVVVFEPGSNNQKYIQHNISGVDQIELVQKAVSNEDGATLFFEEELTGQNNSLLKDYEVFETNREGSYSEDAYATHEVEVVRLDSFLGQRELKPDLIKIDVEGAEWMVLEGAQRTIAEDLPVLMVEITHRKEDAYEVLKNLKYRLFDASGREITDSSWKSPNVHALHPAKHQEIIEALGWPRQKSV